LAGSRQKSAIATTNNSVPGAPNRISFAKLREPLEVPGLLDVQTESFEWLIGSERWRANAKARGDVNPVGGLEEVLAELSPIEDFSGSMSLTFRDHRGPGIIFRMVPARAIAADQLGLSAEVQALCSEADGVVLVTGGRDSGRSTLLTITHSDALAFAQVLILG